MFEGTNQECINYITICIYVCVKINFYWYKSGNFESVALVKLNETFVQIVLKFFRPLALLSFSVNVPHFNSLALTPNQVKYRT
jgi:hypothetical protein